MFGVATDLAAGFVSSVVGTDMITLTFGTTATMGYSTQPGKFVLTGANAESITTSFSGSQRHHPNGSLGWSYTLDPKLQLIIPSGIYQDSPLSKPSLQRGFFYCSLPLTFRMELHHRPSAQSQALSSWERFFYSLIV